MSPNYRLTVWDPWDARIHIGDGTRTLSYFEWCSREALRINSREGRVADVQKRGRLVALFVNKVTG